MLFVGNMADIHTPKWADFFETKHEVIKFHVEHCNYGSVINLRSIIKFYKPSSVAIRARIRKLVADEDPGNPLSDAQLAGVLAREGASARRTVAKYREALGIASSSERRQGAARARA